MHMLMVNVMIRFTCGYSAKTPVWTWGLWLYLPSKNCKNTGKKLVNEQQLKYKTNVTFKMKRRKQIQSKTHKRSVSNKKKKKKMWVWEKLCCHSVWLCSCSSWYFEANEQTSSCAKRQNIISLASLVQLWAPQRYTKTKPPQRDHRPCRMESVTGTDSTQDLHYIV